MNESLVLESVKKTYSGFELNDVSFTLPSGYIMGLIGPNGAGKTTTIQLILNMIERDAGEIAVFGMDNIEYEKAVKQDVGVVFDSSFYVGDWTAKETGRVNSIFYINWDTNLYRKLLKRFDLPLDKKVKDFSRGMRMKLMLSCAFSHDAKLLILDEPTSGLDPVIRDEFLELLQDFIKDGKHSVLFSTHITTDLEQVADYITYLNQGNMVYTGSLDEFLDRYKVIKGRLSDLTDDLEREILGLRKTDIGFEGLIYTRLSEHLDGFLFDTATINDIVVYTSKERS